MSTFSLPSSQFAVITVPAGSTARLTRLSNSAGAADGATERLAAGTHNVGPFDLWTRWRLDTVAGSTGGGATYAVQEADPGIGSSALSNAAVYEMNHGVVRRTVIALDAQVITLTDEAGVGQYGSLKLYDFPAGNILVLGAVADLDLALVDTEWIDTAEGDLAIGSTAVTDGNALATTEVDIAASAAIAALVAQAGPANVQSTAAFVSQKAGATDLDAFLNVRIDDNAAHVTGTGTVSGKVTLVWVNLGDF